MPSQISASDAHDEAERRAAVRAPFQLPCELVMDGRTHAASSVNISEGGLGALVGPEMGRPDFLQGRSVRVRLTLDGIALALSAVIVRAEVVPTGEVMLALCFTNVTEAEANDIRKQVFAQLRAIRAAGRL